MRITALELEHEAVEEYLLNFHALGLIGKAKDVPFASVVASIKAMDSSRDKLEEAHDRAKSDAEPISERIEAVLNDGTLTDGEALDAILEIIGHEREVNE